MSKITIVGGDILEYIGGKDLSYATEGIEFTSEKEVVFTARKGISYGKPKKPKIEDVITNAIVYFRPVSKNGEFGFDWLRENDNGLCEKNDPAYKDIIESGYNDKGRRDLTPAEAFEKLKNQYEIIPMKFGSKVDGASTSNREYFVPYLTLFSKEYVTGEMKQQYKNLFTEPKYEAELKVLLEIEEDVDRLEFDYNDSFFEIDKKVLKDKTKTAGLVVSADTSIKITCLKDLPIEMEICIYAYPKNCQQPLIERRLAGKIKVLQNDKKIRKEEKIVLVGVKTDIYGGRIVTGQFSSEAKYKLYNILYQALIIPIIIEDKDKIILDLSTNKAFQKGGVYIKEAKEKNSVFSAGENSESIKEMKKLFMSDPKNEIFKKEDYFTIFSTELINERQNVGGKVEDINIRNAIMFADCNTPTAVHETLHGLGLYHTHREPTETTIINQRKKYVYQRDTTTNVMSYSLNKKILWRWQWHIINPNISEK